ncbi:hypothetical protein B5C34_05450 [Pacificimonas flava]|uniref:HTH tetR-type domain-containing protein n=2 Tax=Pacificimonas TaxID=1960290 RepID=A0A219B5B7_9SPHN|nr:MULTISPECIES: TetR/AcrR family transcriptional regulator [Pacificimonas]MBZ6377334.1 TetR/AcrR family transcriptional regulator [Pacificimonas aurantium]OWV32958.1 hypothetical protein B5C34_05450 [Pacificimonas flava]
MATKVADTKARRYDPAETRTRVLEAANNLFSQQGFSKTGTADIARAANVSEGSIFYHFGSKRALLEELGRMYGERMCEAMQGGDALGELTPAISIQRCFAYCETHKTWEKLMHDSPDGTKKGMSSNPEAEPFYRASKETVVTWCRRQFEAMKEVHDLKDFNPDIAAPLTYGVVGDALDLAFAEDATPERRKEIEHETIRFVCAACGVEHLC